MGRAGSALWVLGLEPAQVGSKSHSCWVPLWSELVFLGLVQFHIHWIKPIATTTGCAGDGNFWKLFVSMKMDPSLEQGYLYRNIYAKANLTSGDCMKLACILYHFKTRTTCLAATGLFLPLCNPVTLVRGSKLRVHKVCQAFSNTDGWMGISVLLLLIFKTPEQGFKMQPGSGWI